MTEQTTRGRPAFSPWLAETIGHVVLEASQCEDTLGELVLLDCDINDREIDQNWWQSGAALAAAVRAISDAEAATIAETYLALVPKRNAIVHGLWIEKPGMYLNVSRIKSTRKAPRDPGLTFNFRWTEESLNAVAREFNGLERMAADTISRYMGLDN